VLKNPNNIFSPFHTQAVFIVVAGIIAIAYSFSIGEYEIYAPIIFYPMIFAALLGVFSIVLWFLWYFSEKKN
jgi:hypothetical protein